MAKRYNYKVWNADLSQFVAQADMRTADEISAIGGVIIPELSSIPGLSEPRAVWPMVERTAEFTSVR